MKSRYTSIQLRVISCSVLSFDIEIGSNITPSGRSKLAAPITYESIRRAKRQIQPATNVSAIVSALISGIGNTSGHLVKLSIAVSMHDIPSIELGRPTRSTWMSAKRAVGGDECSIGE